jgi:Flp pilus assembly protein TadD
MGKITSTTALLLLFFFAAQPLCAEFYASKTSDKYHNPNCELVKRIKPARLIKFANPEDARKAGYIPCKYCKPPLSSKIKEEAIEDTKAGNYKEWFHKGYVLSDSGDYRAAIDAFSKGVQTNPNDGKAYYNRGLAYAKTGKQEQAIEDFNKAIDLNPRYAMAYSNRGVIYLSRKEYEKAIEDFNMAIELDPLHPWAYYNKSCLYSLKNEVNKSCKWLKKAIEEGYDNWNHIRTDTDLNNIRSSDCYKNLMPGRQ